MATTTSPVCTIDATTRVITVPAEYKELGVESDERATRINFRCPKIVGDGIDLSALNLYINYENANKKLNSYLVDDVTVSGSNIEFSWLLSRHVTEASGTVRYIVCAKKSDDKEVVNEWNTKVATGTVNAGLEATAEIEEQNIDIIEQILKCIVELENNQGGSSDITLGLTSATVGQIAKIATVDTDGKPTKWEATDIAAVTVDSALSSTSENPVQNKAIKAELDKKSTFSGSYNDLKDKPTIPDIVTYRTVTGPAYTNQIDEVGYTSGATLDMSGAVASGSSYVSGFIPITKGDMIRVKDPSSTTFSTGLVFALYNSDKATGSNIGRYINTMQADAAYGAVTISGDTLTWDTSSVGYYFWSDFAYLRVTTNSADSIVTVNEEIVYTTTQVAELKPEFKVTEENLSFETAQPILSGKEIAVFGDSIIGMSRDATSVPAYTAAFTGATVHNIGFGGCRMSVHPTSGYAAFSMWALADAITSGTYTTQDAQAESGQDYFATQLAALKAIDFNKIDAIVIHYGTNDFAASCTIDNTDNDADTTTVCGALRYSIRKILTTYPKIRIFVSAPIYRMWNDTGAETYTNSLGKNLPEYVSAILAVAAEFNLPVIDGYHALGINSINDSVFSSDGTHLNEYGRKVFGEYIGGCLITSEIPKGADGQGGGSGGETWELINEIEMSEAASLVTIDKDKDGNPFTLRRVKMECTIVLDTDDPFTMVKTNLNDQITINNAQPKSASKTPRYYSFYAEHIPGAGVLTWHDCSGERANWSSQIQQMGHTYNDLYKAAGITSLTIVPNDGNKNFGLAGTTISLLGVRA